MKRFFYITFVALIVLGCSSSKKNAEVCTSKFYEFSVPDIRGKEVKMSDFKGKVALVVNTASKCGYTPQFAGLEEIYEKYKASGFVVLGFPSNQFGKQDPGTNEEILEFCQANYGVTFPMFEKIDVNGENAHPLYVFLKNNTPNGDNGDIKWNFTKFLIDKKGNVIKRYESKVKPGEIENDIQAALKGKK